MIDSVAIPISTAARRLEAGFLGYCLESLFRHSNRTHEVIIVTETLDAVNAFVRDHGWAARVTVLPGDPKEETVPVYRFMNIGIRAAKTPWSMSPVGDDTYFPPEWEKLLNAVDQDRKDLAIWIPRHMTTSAGGLSGGTTQAGNAERHVHPDDNSGFIREALLIEAVRTWTNGTYGRTVEEPCGRSGLVSWPHAVIHRDLFERVGGYIETPPYPDAHDIHFNDALRDRFGVTAVGVHSSCIVNARVPVRL